MSAHKHTPGPWKYTKPAISGDRGIHAEGTGIFAEAFSDIRCAGENNAAEAESNARLIAAAPDLLAAAESALNFIANTEGEMGIALESGDKLRAAIAKATEASA